MQNKWRGRVRSPKLIIATILVLASFFVVNQEAIAGVTGKVAGVVRDSETGETLPRANCILVGTDLGAACDVDGDYFIINIPPGTYSLEVRMMGYESVTQTGVIVSADHTTPVDFELRPVAVAVPGITVVAKREIVKLDLSSSSFVAEDEEIEAIPLITDVEDYVNLLAGVEGFVIRGGGLDQTAFMMDGLMMVDNRTNELVMKPNLSSIKEFNLIKGGFNAEYGNVRSGIINIVTQEGSPREYHGSIDIRVSPPHLKHHGPSLFDHDNFYLRPYLDEAVCWVGTKNGTWDEETQEQYWEFEGWNAVSEELMGDGDPTNDRTPEECRDRFIWLHRCEGSESLEGISRPHGEYGHKPDWSVDLGFGGPVPIIRNLSFFTSYRSNNEMFGLPTYIDYYTEDNAQLKLTYRITPNLKLSIDGLYGEIHSVARIADHVSSDNDYVKGGDAFLWADHSTAGGTDLYYPSAHSPFDVYRNMQGITLTHALSPSTFHSLRFNRTYVRNWCNGEVRWRDTTTVRFFGNTPVDESPLGAFDPPDALIEYSMLYGGWQASARDWSIGTTINVNSDLTSQINKYNQIKFGFDYNYNHLDTKYGVECGFMPVRNRKDEFLGNPHRAGVYIQDKIEFEGIIANIGVRLDYSSANIDWYTLDRYSKYFSTSYMHLLKEEAPTEAAESHLKVSPRFGISHPIGINSKIYFNYGHFYSIAPARDLYTIDYGYVQQWGISFLGNPSADLPRTVAYELGYEHNIADLFLLSIAGYYKDVTAQTGSVWYTNYDETVEYSTIENNNYADIRGFEFNLNKSFGRWITGWINYNYMVTTSGYVGRRQYFQDKRMERLYGLQNPYQERPLARPVLRANIRFATPEDWGPTIAGIKLFGDIHLSLLYSWKAGSYQTWDPLETYELTDNLQWKDYSNWEARFSKEVAIGVTHISLFMDVSNLFNTKQLNSLGFEDVDDRRDYLESLHLPMYEGEEYEGAGFEGGNDQPGDIKSKNKPYINMPNLNFLTFLNPRAVTFGLRVNF